MVGVGGDILTVYHRTKKKFEQRDEIRENFITLRKLFFPWQVTSPENPTRKKQRCSLFRFRTTTQRGGSWSK